MAQHDYVIANDTAANVRSDLNDALSAIASQNSGATAPSTTYANMLWYDTANNILKMRSEADDAWIDIGTLNQSTNEFEVAGLVTLSEATWEAGTSTTESLVSPAKVKAAADTVKISSVDTTTDAAAVEFDLDGTQYQSYELVIDYLLPATDGVDVGIQFSSDGGSTYETGAAAYSHASVYRDSGVFGSRETGDSFLKIAAGGGVGAAAGEGMASAINIFAAHTTDKTRVAAETPISTAGGNLRYFSAHGYENTGASRDAFRIICSSGDISEIRATLYGRK